MNIDTLKQQVDNLIKTLQAYQVEAEGVEQTIKSAVDASNVQISREKFLNERAIALKEKEKQLAEQEGFITKQSENTRLLLGKIKVEREDLQKLIDQKDEIEEKRLQNEALSKTLTEREAKLTDMEGERDAIIQERKEIASQRELEAERKRILDIREQHIHEKEEGLRRIEEMTQI